jgi:hypothetical protein
MKYTNVENFATGSIYPTNSPIGIIKINEPAMLVMGLSGSDIVTGGRTSFYVPYIVDNSPWSSNGTYSTITMNSPTASIYPRSYPGFEYSAYNTGGSSNPPLPIPKINLMSNSVQVDVWDKSNNSAHGTPSLIYGYPVLVNMDFTDAHFSDPNNRIFIEMVHYRRKNRSKKGGNNVYKGSSYVIPSKQIAGSGIDTSLPWVSSGGFWNRGGNHTLYDTIAMTTSIIGINRPNHYEVYGYTISTYNIWEYLGGRFEYYNVAYADTSGGTSQIQTLIPSHGKSRGGANNPSSRFAYSSYLTPYYFAFRYIQWLPNANPPYGQIVSGPLTKTLKITPYYFPFNVDYVLSQQFGYPVSSISTEFTNDDGYYKLKCNWETNLP